MKCAECKRKIRGNSELLYVTLPADSVDGESEDWGLHTKCDEEYNRGGRAIYPSETEDEDEEGCVGLDDQVGREA